MLSPVLSPIFSPVISPMLGRGTASPPVSDKLIAWLPGNNVSNTVKLDMINAYNFTIANCPNDELQDFLGSSLLDLQSNPVWFTQVFAGWGCEYKAPVSGQLGHTQLLAADLGNVLYTGTTPNALTKAGMMTISNDRMFWDHTREAFLVYNTTLTGDELYEVLLYCGKMQMLAHNGEAVGASGEQIVVRTI